MAQPDHFREALLRLKCQQCMSAFDLETHAPYSLDCFHDVCSECVHRALKLHLQSVSPQHGTRHLEPKSLACQVCGNLSYLPNDLTSLPKNTYKRELVTLLSTPSAHLTSPMSPPVGTSGDELTHPHTCKECGNEEKEPATHTCVQCNAGLCALHAKGHAKSSATKLHQIIPVLAAVTPRGSSSTSECLKHHSALKFFCNLHNEALCAECALSQHDRCSVEKKVVSLADAIAQQKERIKLEIPAAESYLQYLSEAANRVAAVMETLNSNETTSAHAVDEYFSQRQRSLRQELASICARKRKTLAQQNDKLLLDIFRLSKSLEDSRSSLSRGGDVRLLFAARTLHAATLQRDASPQVAAGVAFFPEVDANSGLFGVIRSEEGHRLSTLRERSLSIASTSSMVSGIMGECYNTFASW